MNKIIERISAAVLIISVSACAVQRPNASKIQGPDYNARTFITEPSYYNKKTPAGHAVTIGLPIAGAVAGYAFPAVHKEAATGKESVPLGGAAVGALVGAGLSAISSAISHYGRVSPADNYDKWVSQAAPHHILVRSQGKTLVLMDPEIESAYTVKNMLDVEDFARAFPGSAFQQMVADQALQVLGRNDYVQLAKLLDNPQVAYKIKSEYIYASPSIAELEKALRLYPEVTIQNRQKLYMSCCHSIEDALRYKELYPSAPEYDREVLKNVFAQDVSKQKNELKKLARVYSDDFYLHPIYLNDCTEDVQRNYIRALGVVNDSVKMSELEKIFNWYESVSYPGKAEDVLDAVWAVADNTYSKGTDIISAVGRVSTTAYGSSLGLTPSRVKGFVEEKLKKEVKDNVVILTKNVISSTSDEFQKWRKALYSAGVVTQGEITYLIYGEVKNNSKFDLPLTFNIGFNLTQKISLEKSSFFGGIANFLGQITGTPMEQKQKIAHVSVSDFVIPTLRAGESGIYAGSYDLTENALKELGQNGISAGGFNFGELLKASSQLLLEDLGVYIFYSDVPPTEEQLRKAEKNQKLAQNGLPKGVLVDFFRNKAYRQSTWDEEWARISREAAKNAGNMSSRASSSKESSYSGRSSETSSADVNVEGLEMPAYTWETTWYPDGFFTTAEDRPTNESGENQVRVIKFPGVGTGKIYRVIGSDGYWSSKKRYKTLDDAIIAEYAYQKYGEIREKGRR